MKWLLEPHPVHDADGDHYYRRLRASASSPPIYRLIRWLARIPRTPRGAVAFVAFFSMATSLISWGFSLIFSGILVREIVKNVRQIDYRAIGAAAYMGTGSVWALGLVVIRRPDDGHAVSDGCPIAQDQRGNSIEPDHLHLAKPHNRDHPDSLWCRRGVPVCSGNLNQDGRIIRGHGRT